MISQLEGSLWPTPRSLRNILFLRRYTKDGVPVEDEMTEREFTKFDAKSVKKSHFRVKGFGLYN